MPCLRCGSEYGIFKKESYCRNCGFSFCSGCLSKKIIVPKLGSDSKHAVCNKCFGLLSSGKSEVNANGRAASPPAALKKRMELLAAQQNSNVATNGIGKYPTSHDKDREIADRLERLRAERNPGPVPSLSQLEERLAKLKDIPKESLQESKTAYVKPDTRTAAEQARDLLQQTSEVVEMNSRLPNPEKEIRERLARLRSDDASLNDLNKATVVPTSDNRPSSTSHVPSSFPTEGTAPVEPEILEVWQYLVEAEKEVCREAEEALRMQEKDVELKQKLEEIKANRDRTKRPSSCKIPNGDVSDEDNEDKIADKVIEQFLGEARLEGVTKFIPVPQNKNHPHHQNERKLINSSDNEENENLDELPWCTICNEDASVRCHGCDRDLFCRRCFRECHDTSELRDHPTSPFRPKAIHDY